MALEPEGYLIGPALLKQIRLMVREQVNETKTTTPTKPKKRPRPPASTALPWVGEARADIDRGDTGAIARDVDDVSADEVQGINCGLRVADEDPILIWRVKNPDDPNVPYVFMPCPTTCYGVQGLFGLPTTGIDSGANDEVLKFTDAGCDTEEIDDCPAAAAAPAHTYATLAELLADDPTLLAAGTVGAVTNDGVAGGLLYE